LLAKGMGLNLSIVVPFVHVVFKKLEVAFPRFLDAREISLDGKVTGKARDVMAKFQSDEYSSMRRIGELVSLPFLFPLV